MSTKHLEDKIGKKIYDSTKQDYRTDKYRQKKCDQWISLQKMNSTEYRIPSIVESEREKNYTQKVKQPIVDKKKMSKKLKSNLFDLESPNFINSNDFNDEFIADFDIEKYSNKSNKNRKSSEHKNMKFELDTDKAIAKHEKPYNHHRNNGRKVKHHENVGLKAKHHEKPLFAYHPISKQLEQMPVIDKDEKFDFDFTISDKNIESKRRTDFDFGEPLKNDNITPAQNKRKRRYLDNSPINDFTPLHKKKKHHEHDDSDINRTSRTSRTSGSAKFRGNEIISKNVIVSSVERKKYTNAITPTSSCKNEKHLKSYKKYDDTFEYESTHGNNRPESKLSKVIQNIEYPLSAMKMSTVTLQPIFHVNCKNLIIKSD